MFVLSRQKKKIARGKKDHPVRTYYHYTALHSQQTHMGEINYKAQLENIKAGDYIAVDVYACSSTFKAVKVCDCFGKYAP